MHAFFAIERRHPGLARRDGLAGTELDADFRAALLAQFRVEEDDVIGVAGRRLDLAAEQQRVLIPNASLLTNAVIVKRASSPEP